MTVFRPAGKFGIFSLPPQTHSCQARIRHWTCAGPVHWVLGCETDHSFPHRVEIIIYLLLPVTPCCTPFVFSVLRLRDVPQHEHLWMGFQGRHSPDLADRNRADVQLAGRPNPRLQFWHQRWESQSYYKFCQLLSSSDCLHIYMCSRRLHVCGNVAVPAPTRQKHLPRGHFAESTPSQYRARRLLHNFRVSFREPCINELVNNRTVYYHEASCEIYVELSWLKFAMN